MRHSLLRAVVVFAVPLVAAPLVPAQNELGLFVGAGSTTAVTRAFDAAEELFTRIDASDYAGLGVDPAAPTRITITGLRAAVYDFDRSTPDPFRMVVRTEGATPNQPEVAGAPLARTAPIQISAASGAGGATFLCAFATPVTAPAGQDLFVGCEMPPFTDAATDDAVWLFAVDGTGNGVQTFDLPGPAADTSSAVSDTYAHAYVPAGPSAGVHDLSRRYLLAEPELFGAGGVCTAVTNQASMLSSAAGPGLGGPLSGLHPDVNGRSPGRLDDPGYRFLDASMAGQNVAFFISGFGLSPNPTPAAAFVPGSTGSLCVNDLGLDVAATVADRNGEAALNAPLDPVARAAVGGTGVTLTWFAIAFDGTRLSASPCGVQTF